MDKALWVMSMVMEAAVVLLLVYRRNFRILPVFCSYVLWAFLSDVLMYVVSSRHSPQYLQIYLTELSIDSVLQFGVLVELAWSTLRPVRNVLPRWTILVIAILVIIAGAVIWPFAGVSGLKTLPHEWIVLMRLQQTASILRVVFFLLMAALSQVLALGWRHRELQVATGLGFYSLVSLGAAMLHTHQTNTTPYHHVDQLVVAVYFCSLLYWAVSFAQKEAPRQEFSPKMQSFLLAMAGVAKANRIAVTSHPGSGGRKGQDR